MKTILTSFVFLALAITPTNRGFSVSVESSGARTAAELYTKNCASCHGRDGRAKTFKAKFNHARNLTDSAWQDEVSDERIFNSIRNGRGKKMPAYNRKLSDPEIESLVAFVRALRK